MPNVVEHEAYHDHHPVGSSTGGILVAVAAVVVVSALAFFVYQNNRAPTAAPATPGTVDVNINGQIPAKTNPGTTPGY